MRAHSKSSRIFGFGPLEAIAAQPTDRSTGQGILALPTGPSAIGLEPGTHHLHAIRAGDALTGGGRRVWLRCRLYWLR